MISVRDLEIRIGARVLMSGVNFRVDKGDKVGLVGRNGAGKTTLTKILAGDGQPSKGFVDRGGEIGYLPQDPRSGDPEELARTRILNARGLGTIAAEMAKCTEDMGSVDEAVYENAMNRYSELEERFQSAGGYAAEAEAATIASNLNLKDHILDQPLKTLSGGQRRRIELARIHGRGPGGARQLIRLQRRAVLRAGVAGPGGVGDGLRLQAGDHGPRNSSRRRGGEGDAARLGRALLRFGGNISRTANFVGMERSALHRKLKFLGVHAEDRAPPSATIGNA